MLIRIVKMQFKPEKVADFVAHFETIKDTLRTQEGCIQVQVFRAMDDPNTFFTYSHWETEAYLEQYRKSAFFNDVWAYTKTLFQDKPQAWSVTDTYL